MEVVLTGDIFHTQQVGGVSRYFVELLKSLRRHADIEATVNAPLHINQHLYQERNTLGHRGLYLSKYFRGLSHIERAASWAQRVCMPSPNVVHATYYEPASLRWAAARKVVTFYDMIDERFIPDSPVIPRKRECFELSDHCIAISEQTKSDIVHFYKTDPDKITVIYLATGIEAAEQTPQPNTKRRETSRPVVLWVGGRDGYKNFVSLVRGFGRSRCCRDGGRILCVGGPPFSSAELSLSAECGVRREAIGREVCDDTTLTALYQMSDVLAYVSCFEGFGLPPLEAMQCGCPVIASNVGSSPEVVGDAALLVNPTNPDEIAHAIDRVVFDSDVASSLIESGRRRAASFSWTRCGDLTAQVYRTLTG